MTDAGLPQYDLCRRETMLDNFDINKINDLPSARKCILLLYNLVEEMKQENRELREQNQRLQDENNRLKGEQGKPDIKPNKKPPSSDCSSEKERRCPKERKKKKKKNRIKIDRTQVLNVDTELLPEDAISKGHVNVVVQDLNVVTENVLFRKEKYYSPSKRKTYLAELPPGYDGEFGPGIKSLAITLYFAYNMSEPNILQFFHDAGTFISAGQLSNFLIKKQEPFHEEKDAVYEAGLRSSPWQHIDDTKTRVEGRNQHCQILCNPLYTAYFTTEKKSRLSVLDVLGNFRERKFLFNKETFTYLKMFKLPFLVVRQLKSFPRKKEMGEEDFLQRLAKRLPNLGPLQYTRVLESAAVAAYHAQMEFPVIQLLVCDDAKQFRVLTRELSLCWVHDGRHYKKLFPFILYHRQLLDKFLGRYWKYYDRLLEYKKYPTAEGKEKLDEDFDDLFSTITGYDALDERIAKTKAKKRSLLMVLEHPEIPLHNNPAELGARKRVRKRDVSFGTRSRDGTRAWDTFMTLAATAKKLGISFYKYIYDRVSCDYEMPHLADLIAERTEKLQLGGSWSQGP